VLAHRECNSAKRGLLASKEHLAAWVERNRRLGKSVSSGATIDKVTWTHL
jgi:hypothetical protein